MACEPDSMNSEQVFLRRSNQHSEGLRTSMAVSVAGRTPQMCFPYGAPPASHWLAACNRHHFVPDTLPQREREK